jgi:polyhydroxybutyrate depolymerase
MSFRLACELSDHIAGIAPVTATLSEDLAPTCQPEAPVKLLLINGTTDPLVPYDGGMVTLPPDDIPRGQVRSTTNTMQFWADHNQCDPEPVMMELPNTNKRDDTRPQQTTYTNCLKPVQLITIVNGGHTWPGGVQYMPIFVVGRTSRDIDASQVIWDFFAAEP